MDDRIHRINGNVRHHNHMRPVWKQNLYVVATATRNKPFHKGWFQIILELRNKRTQLNEAPKSQLNTERLSRTFSKREIPPKTLSSAQIARLYKLITILT
jgi:hypothetical protein